MKKIKHEIAFLSFFLPLNPQQMKKCRLKKNVFVT